VSTDLFLFFNFEIVFTCQSQPLLLTLLLTHFSQCFDVIHNGKSPRCFLVARLTTKKRLARSELLWIQKNTASGWIFNHPITSVVCGRARRANHVGNRRSPYSRQHVHKHSDSQIGHVSEISHSDPRWKLCKYEMV
jgi:hypothetical protein